MLQMFSFHILQHSLYKNEYQVAESADPSGRVVWRCGSASACLLGLCIRIPLGAWMFVFFEWCVLSGRDLYEGLIPCPDESLRVIMPQVTLRLQD